MPRLVLAGNERGEFGVEYNDRNGRVTGLWSTNDRPVFGRVVLANGQSFESTFPARTTLDLTGRGIRVVTDPTDPEGGLTLSGILTMTFQWGE